jgi:hypothetical protein
MSLSKSSILPGEERPIVADYIAFEIEGKMVTIPFKMSIGETKEFHAAGYTFDGKPAPIYDAKIFIADTRNEVREQTGGFQFTAMTVGRFVAGAITTTIGDPLKIVRGFVTIDVV